MGSIGSTVVDEKVLGRDNPGACKRGREIEHVNNSRRGVIHSREVLHDTGVISGNGDEEEVEISEQEQNQESRFVEVRFNDGDGHPVPVHLDEFYLI